MQRLQASERPVFAAAAEDAIPAGPEATTAGAATAGPDALLPSAQPASAAISLASVAEAVATTVQSVLGSSVPPEEPLMSGAASAAVLGTDAGTWGAQPEQLRVPGAPAAVSCRAGVRCSLCIK